MLGTGLTENSATRAWYADRLAPDHEVFLQFRIRGATVARSFHHKNCGVWFLPFLWTRNRAEWRCLETRGVQGYCEEARATSLRQKED